MDPIGSTSLSDSTIDVGFVGLGRIASILEDDPLREKPATHAGAVTAHPRCRIAGGFDLLRERREGFAKRWSVPVDSGIDQLLARRPGILVIATDPDSHFLYLRTAVEAGIPVVVCEKPVADRYGTARRMARLERTTSTRIVVNHERRFSRDYQLVRRAVASGEMGTLLQVRGTLYFGSTGRHDRVFLHDGTHIVDAIHFLTDDLIRLKTKVGRYRTHRSSVFLHGILRNRQIPVEIEIGGERNYLRFEVTLSFSDGEIRLGNGVFTWEKSRPSPHYSSYRSLINAEKRIPEPSGYFSGMIEEAVRLHDEPGASSASSLADGAAAMRVIRDARRLW
ncbi:MAG: Gfo/Idh/MocA family protein [Alkalispirochaeta sp.]